MAVTQATFPPSPIYGLVRTSDRTAIALTRAGGEGSSSEDRRRPIQHPPTPPPVIPEFAKQMSGTQKAKQNKPSLDPGLCLRQNREDELRDLRANLSARVPSSPTLHASFSQEPRRYRSVCWAARKSDCTAIARGAVKAWQRRSHPETARNSDGSARRAKRPHRKHFVPRAPRRPPRRLRPRGHNNCYDPGWPRQ